MALNSFTDDPGSYEDSLHANYALLREERGWSWTTLAESLTRQGEPSLAEWALAQEPTPDKSKRATPGKRENTAATPPTSTR